MQTGPAAGDHPWMGTPEYNCSGGKGRGCSGSVGNEQTIGIGLLCLLPASGAGEMSSGSNEAEERLELKDRQGRASTS